MVRVKKEHKCFIQEHIMLDKKITMESKDSTMIVPWSPRYHGTSPKRFLLKYCLLIKSYTPLEHRKHVVSFSAESCA